METKKLKTFHAPAERLDIESIKKQASRLNNTNSYINTFDSINIFVVIVNSYRQIVYANKKYLGLLKIEDLSDILGKRLGESINCINALKNEGGCGTSKPCKSCSAGNIILKSINLTEESEGEVSIIRKDGDFDFPINIFEKVVPIEIDNEIFYLGSFIDITDSIRKRAMERLFFHDIINTAGALKGILGLLKTEVPQAHKIEVEQVEGLFGGLLDEIQSQRQMLAAENNELVLEVKEFNSKEVLISLKKLYQEYSTSFGKAIEIAQDSISIDIKSDSTLLKRVVSNMIKNAIEVNDENRIITIGCDETKDANIRYWVKNHSYICDEIQDSIFKRAFSTKGNDRGIGTYGMKLLGERYLGGKVWFTSSKSKGTCFYIEIPKKILIKR